MKRDYTPRDVESKARLKDPNLPKTCRNGDGKPRHKPYAVCHECLKARDKAYARKIFVPVAWDELNLKNLLDDAKRMDVKNLSIRYQRSQHYICLTLKKHNVPFKKKQGYASKSKEKIKLSRLPDLIDTSYVSIDSKNHSPHIACI